MLSFLYKKVQQNYLWKVHEQTKTKTSVSLCQSVTVNINYTPSQRNDNNTKLPVEKQLFLKLSLIYRYNVLNVIILIYDLSDKSHVLSDKTNVGDHNIHIDNLSYDTLE